jgi:hypothetical protein
MWLTGRLAPDHKTMADFRKDNGPAIGRVCAQFVALCREIGLLTQASVAINGSKFKAVNNRDKNFTRVKMERRLAQIEESVARYLAQLDTADRQESSEALAAKTAHLKEKLAKLATEGERLKGIEKEMLASPDQQISLTDPDSRSMATSGRGSGVVGYNVQVAVDTQHHLIVTHEVTNTGADRDTGVRASRHCGDFAEADDIRRKVEGSLRQAGLCLSPGRGCLSLSCRREADPSLLVRGRRHGPAPLLDIGLLWLPDQTSMYDRAGASHYAMGTRARGRRRPTSSGRKPRSHAPAS